MLDHPNIVKIVEVFQKLNVIYIIMELCTGMYAAVRCGSECGSIELVSATPGCSAAV